MPPQSTLWKLEEHTRGKLSVLENYLDAWLPIMRKWNRRVLYIDAFAGPGKYAGGEDGSPIIALKSLIEHSASQRMKGKINYIFLEQDLERARYLEDVVQPMKGDIPTDCNVSVYNASFDEDLAKVLDKFDEQNKKFAPAFVMIDPFGVSNTPMTVIQRILANPKSEVYISFMYEAINRFKVEPNFAAKPDVLFGSPEWRDGIDIDDRVERKDFLYGLYKKLLKNAGAKYVLHFELYEKERLIYALFFATQHEKGCDVMKKAMWKTAPFDDFRFKSGMENQLTLGMQTVDFTILKEALHDEFGQQGWVDIESVEKFVKTDKTNFHSGHLKKITLKPMERDGELEIKPDDPKRRKYSYKKGTLLRFVKPGLSGEARGRNLDRLL